MSRYAILLILFLAACGSNKQENKPDVFYLNFSSGTLESLDPAYSKDLYTMWSTHMIYNTLVETDNQLQVIPSLAKNWEISADGLTYTFHLRRDVFFQAASEFSDPKGRLMTAADLVYSFKRLMDPAIASSGAWIFNGRVSPESAFIAPNDSTFELHLIAPFRPMLAMLSMPYCSIIPHEVADHWGNSFRRHPCGTGPFAYYAWDEGNVLTLHKNAHYWEHDSSGNALPYLQAIQVSFFDSKATEFLLFLQHRLDFVNGLDGSFKDFVLTKDGRLKPDFAHSYKLDRSTYLNTEYIGFLLDSNLATKSGKTIAPTLIRQAINYAIDRKRISIYFRNGVGIPATSGFIPKGLPGYDSTHSFGYSYNPAKAASLLKEAGYPGGQGLSPVVILSPDNWADIVNYISTELAEVGIPCRTEVIQPNILRQQMSAGKAMAFRAQWIADYPDAETYLAFFNSRLPAPPNYTRYHNVEFDRDYDLCMRLPDSLRWITYRRMDSLALSSAPVIPLFYDELLHFTQLNVHGFTSNPMNLLELKRVRKF